MEKTKNKSFNFLLPDNLRKYIEMRAEKSYMTSSQYLVNLIMKDIDLYQKDLQNGLESILAQKRDNNWLYDPGLPDDVKLSAQKVCTYFDQECEKNVKLQEDFHSIVDPVPAVSDVVQKFIDAGVRPDLIHDVTNTPSFFWVFSEKRASSLKAPDSRYCEIKTSHGLNVPEINASEGIVVYDVMDQKYKWCYVPKRL
jgi:hypothetical protein